MASVRVAGKWCTTRQGQNAKAVLCIYGCKRGAKVQNALHGILLDTNSLLGISSRKRHCKIYRFLANLSPSFAIRRPQKWNFVREKGGMETYDLSTSFAVKVRRGLRGPVRGLGAARRAITRTRQPPFFPSWRLRWGIVAVGGRNSPTAICREMRLLMEVLRPVYPCVGSLRRTHALAPRPRDILH